MLPCLLMHQFLVLYCQTALLQKEDWQLQIIAIVACAVGGMGYVCTGKLPLESDCAKVRVFLVPQTPVSRELLVPNLEK